MKWKCRLVLDCRPLQWESRHEKHRRDRNSASEPLNEWVGIGGIGDRMKEERMEAYEREEQELYQTFRKINLVHFVGVQIALDEIVLGTRTKKERISTGKHLTTERQSNNQRIKTKKYWH